MEKQAAADISSAMVEFDVLKNSYEILGILQYFNLLRISSGGTEKLQTHVT